MGKDSCAGRYCLWVIIGVVMMGGLVIVLLFPDIAKSERKSTSNKPPPKSIYREPIASAVYAQPKLKPQGFLQALKSSAKEVLAGGADGLQNQKKRGNFWNFPI